MTQQAEATLELESRPSRRDWRVLARRIFRDKKAVFGLIILAAAILCTAFAELIAPYDPQAQAFELLESPTLGHPLGTDNLGRDMLSRLIHGARISIFAGVVSVIIAGVIGSGLGILSGYYGGWIDMLVMRYIDVQWAFPNIIIAVGLVAIFGLGLQNVIAAITLAYIDDFARVIRGMVLSLKEEDYVTAGRAIGASDFRLMSKHILPNAMPPVIVLASVFVGAAILTEATLSFLGLGVSPLTPTWGSILNDARDFFATAWWLGTFPGLAIMLAVLAMNFIGDAIRDINDVREYGAVAV